MKQHFKNYKKGIIVLPLVLLVILGAFVLLLSAKIEFNNYNLERVNERILWLDLHLKSVKEHLKMLLKSNQTPTNFTEISLQIEPYYYTAIIKKYEKSLTKGQQDFTYYFVDVFGIYRDWRGEFLQEFSTRRSFILCLETP